jgi:catechol 2,3-dioxygenase-like lactoylglutathione lyase family enzyme
MATDLGWKGDLVIAISVKDLKASIAWYEKVLGFKVVYAVEDMGWCEVSTPMENLTIGIGQVEDPKPNESTTPTWGVHDIEKTRKAIEAHGVRFDGPTRETPGMVKLATFFDPDGNPWMLAESLQPL